MTEFYFDIETTDVYPDWGKVLTAQYQPLHMGQPQGDLVILKEWELGEETLIKEVLELGVFDTSDSTWDFIPVGNNLRFDYTFLYHRARKYGIFTNQEGLELEYVIREKPMIDVRSILVLMNDYRFSGSGLDHFTNKGDGAMVPVWYSQGDYQSILEYVETEAKEFIWFLRWVAAPLRVMGDRLRKRKDLLEEEFR